MSEVEGRGEMAEYKGRCTALTHFITPWHDKNDPEAIPPYYCCINAGVDAMFLDGVECPVRCECHEKPAD